MFSKKYKSSNKNKTNKSNKEFKKSLKEFRKKHPCKVKINDYEY